MPFERAPLEKISTDLAKSREVSLKKNYFHTLITVSATAQDLVL